jgi:hypothetical protein
VHAFGEGADHALYVTRELSARVKLAGKHVNLRFGWNFASEEKPKQALRLRLPSNNLGWQSCLYVRDGHATKADALLGI